MANITLIKLKGYNLCVLVYCYYSILLEKLCSNIHKSLYRIKSFIDKYYILSLIHKYENPVVPIFLWYIYNYTKCVARVDNVKLDATSYYMIQLKYIKSNFGFLI